MRTFPHPLTRVVQTAVTVAALALVLSNSVDAAPPRPNIVLIMADDLGFSDIGCYGGEIATPNLDALAKEGLRFTQFYNAARCCPTRAAILTGLYPHQAGVGHMVDSYAAARRAAFNSPAYTTRLNPQTPTIPELLKPAGYRTLMSGKWHLGYQPEEWPAARGFDRSFLMIDGAINYFGFGPQHNSPQGERSFPPMALDRESYTPPLDGFFSTDVFTDRAINFLREPSDSKAPFFLYFSPNAPHWPLHARPETIAKYRGKYHAVGWDRIREQRHARLKELQIIDSAAVLAPRPDALPAWEHAKPERKDAWDEMMAVYAAQVEEMDVAIGRLLVALRESGQAENTLVLFFSDNGGAAERPVKTIGTAPLGTRDNYTGYAIDGAHVSSAPFRKTKKFAHEGGISSPLIANWPAGIPVALRGGRVTEVGHIVDIMATCLDLAGARLPDRWRDAVPSRLEGMSLAPTFSGGTLSRAEPLFWEHEGHRAVRDGKWKLVASYKEPWELYDIGADRTELNDLASSKPDEVARLATQYDMWAQRVGALPWTDLPPPPKPRGSAAPVKTP
jgi:arylsulfatase A-like enzyme